MVVITIAVCNNPIFIEIQISTIKKYIHEPCEVIVFNDCKKFPDNSNFNDITLYSKIREKCEQLKIQCIDVPNDFHRIVSSPSRRHGSTMNYILSYMKSHPNDYFNLDSDMFFIKDFSFDTYRGYTSAICISEKPGYRYMWPNLWYFSEETLKNTDTIDFKPIPTCDTGGGTYKWLSHQEKTNKEKIYYIKHFPSCDWNRESAPAHITGALLTFMENDPRNKGGKFWCELYDSAILHYRAGSNWNNEGRAIHDKLSAQLYSVLQ
jgi:hypothetical protein